jgi:hypothetical protein
MGLPVTLTRTDHAITIRANGETVARIQDWAPQQSRQATPVYELDASNGGAPVDLVPGNLAGLTMTVNRVDLYTKKMEQAWGKDFDITMLTDQNNPLDIQEKWTNPDGTTETWIYKNCWFTSLGRNHSAGGDKITKVNASIAYLYKKRS